ncbi:MAG TPA: adenosine deaminase [Mycobacteriales bacterium]|nr:adenosine deaminase [Mycobacteriales bacterium]
MRDLADLPKAHLHLHLEGGMRPATLHELADRYDVPVPVISGYGSFTAFADTYLAACAVLQTDDDLRRVVRERIEDDAAAGAVWSEPSFYAPHHRERLGADEHVIDVVLDEGLRAAADLGIGFGLMLAADRTEDPELAVTIAHQAVARADRGVVSFGLANDEARFPPGPFAPAYDVAKDGGLLCTPHAGELAGPESVRVALDHLHADRIQHGVRAVEDPALVERIAADGICLDVCPTSNLLLAVVPSLEEHPLRRLLDAGVRCSINSDDPLLFGPDLLAEYELCRTALELSDDHLAQAARASLHGSGAPRELVTTGLNRIDDWLTLPG